MISQGTDVAIIGAGPYGLSVAAHLRSRSLSFRIFGKPMSTWRNQMTSGTFLKSFGFASSLYDPTASFTLADFCREQGLAYSDVIDPVPLETFIKYGLEFQRRLVPSLEQTEIRSVTLTAGGFQLLTEEGETIFARRLVVAAGITHFGYTPPLFAGLPKQFVTHSSEHKEVGRFAGRTVAVIGGGASAGDLAGLLHEAGAQVHWIARRSAIDFHCRPEPEPRSNSQRLLKPRSGLGQGWRARLCANHPLLYHLMPFRFRSYGVYHVNGPAPGWFAKDKVAGRVTMHLGTSMKEVEMDGDAVRLRFDQLDGTSRELHVDHVITATGYKPGLNRLAFMDPNLLSKVKQMDNSPILDRHFESSVPGLYFVGLISANSFGPLCRFAYGAKFTASRIIRHLAVTADEASPHSPRQTNPAPAFDLMMSDTCAGQARSGSGSHYPG